MAKHRAQVSVALSERHWTEFHRIRTECKELCRDLDTNPQIDELSGVSAVLARRLFADACRLLSREPGGRALVRLPAGLAIPRAIMRASLFDLQRALAAFRQSHSR